MDAAIFGLVVADLIAEPFNLRAPPAPAGLQLINSISLTTGGNVSNTGLAMAKLGANVAAAGLVGHRRRRRARRRARLLPHPWRHNPPRLRGLPPLLPALSAVPVPPGRLLRPPPRPHPAPPRTPPRPPPARAKTENRPRHRQPAG